MLDTLAPWVGLLGLIGFAGLAAFKHPVDKDRSGGGVRLLGLLGLTGLIGFWIPACAFGPWFFVMAWYVSKAAKEQAAGSR